MGIQLQAIGRSIAAVKGVKPARSAARKVSSKKSRWPQLLLLTLTTRGDSRVDIGNLRKRLSYIASLERSLKRARTPYEERLFFRGIKAVFQSVQHNGLIGRSAVKSLPPTKSRRHLARLLVSVMKKALKKRIAELIELKQVKLMDLPSSNAPTRKRAPRKRRTQRIEPYLNLIRDLPKK